MKKELMILISIIGCTLTLFLNQYVGPVIASAIIGLIGGLILKEYGELNYSASFAGMSSIGVISLIYSPIVGTLVFIIWLLFEGKFEGVGGKLGTIAFIAGITYALFAGTITITGTWNLDLMNILLGMITGIIGATLTLIIRQKITENSVIASSITGLIGGLLMPILAPIIFSASFAGMTSKNLLKGYKEFAISGALTGLIFTIFQGVMPNVGGKLGFIGFIAVLFTKRLN